MTTQTPLSEQQLAEIRNLLALTPDGYLAALLAEVERLTAERHSTNEALSDAAEAIRAKDQRITELETEVAVRGAHAEHLAKCLVERTTELLNAEASVRGLEARLHAVGTATTYRLETGKKFLYVEDIADAVLGREAFKAGESK